MRVVIGFESMFGTTRRVAQAIGRGFAADDDVSVLPIRELGHDQLAAAELLVVGVPTHVHGLPSATTRRSAIDGVVTRYEHQVVDPDATVTYGVREWLADLPQACDVAVATFDTRSHLPAWLVGHPARRVARQLVKRGATQLTAPESFLLGKQERLLDGELSRAAEWGAHLRVLAFRHAGQHLDRESPIR
jgi:hypothetical protein